MCKNESLIAAFRAVPHSFACSKQRSTKSVAMAEQTQSVEPRLQAAQEGVPEKVVEAEVDADKPNGYKIVRTATGKNYVEANEYDPLEHHRSRDKESNKGSGLGFMFCCCAPSAKEVEESVEHPGPSP